MRSPRFTQILENKDLSGLSDESPGPMTELSDVTEPGQDDESEEQPPGS